MLKTEQMFLKRYAPDWLLRGEPSGSHAVPTAAICTVHGSQLASYQVTAANNVYIYGNP